MALCQKFGRLLIGAEARFSARTDVTNISTSLNQSPAPTQIRARLPYNVPTAYSLFTKEQLTGQNRSTENFKIVSTNWKSLSAEEKQNYSKRAKKIGYELRDNFEKLTDGQKKDLWDKHVEKRNNRMKRKLNKFYVETNRPKQPLPSYIVFVKERFEKQTEPLKTMDKVRKFGVEMGQQWRQMTDAEKRPYVDQAQDKSAAYHMELAEWKRKYANEIRAWKEAEAKAAQKARGTQFNQAFEWNIEDDMDLNEKEAIQQMFLDDSTHLVEKRERSSDDDDRDVEEAAASQRSVANISTSLGQSPAPKQIHTRLPPGYRAPNAYSLFTKDQMTGQNRSTENFKIVSTNWKNLSEEEKQEYSERAKKICDESRDNFEKLTDGQKKDLCDKHVEKRNKLQRLRMRIKLNKFYAETNRPKLPPRSYMGFMKECFEKQTKPIKTRDKVNKFVAETAQQWRQMTDAEKKPYVDQAQDKSAAYHTEMAEWKQKYANEIEATAKAALKARDTQFKQAPSEWNIDADRDVDEKEVIHQMLLDDSTHLVEKREWSRDDDRNEDEEAAIQRSVLTNISTSLDQSPAPTQIPARLPYKAPNAFTLFTKDRLRGKNDPETFKIVSTNWKNLSEDEKQEYSERAKKIGDELRDNFEKLTDGQKKDLWDKHVEKRNKLQRLRMKMKLQKFHAETNRPKRPLTSYFVFIKERFEKQTEPIKTKDKVNKFAVEMGQQWRQMTDAEKRPYVEQEQCNIAMFRVEMAEWKQKYANGIRTWKETEAKAALEARDTQFTEASLFELNIEDDRDLNEQEAIQQILLDDSTHLVEKRERSSDDDDRGGDEEKAAIQRIVFTNQLPAPAQNPARLPYNTLKSYALFTKDQMTGQCGGPELVKILSANWKNLSEEEKQNYSERAKKICDELRDNFEKLTNRQKKDLWDKHVEKRNKLQRYRMKKKRQKFYAETNRPERPLVSYSVFTKERFENHTKPIKTRDERKKIFAETGQRWRQMTAAEKQPYVDQAQANIPAYHMEMAEWKRKYANEIRAWKEAEAKAARKARDTQFTQAFEWNLDDDRDVLVDERERIQQMLLDDSTHLVEERELSSDDDRDEDEEAAIQRMFLAISTYLGRKEISQNQRIEY